MQPSKTEFRGAEALRLATRKIELIAPTGFGPRLLSLRSLADGPNLLLEFPQGLDDSAGKEGFRLRGGHRLWHAPEHIVRSYQPDNGPVKVKLSRAGFRLTAATEARTGLRKSVAVEALNDRTLRITHELSNEGLWAVECAPWALTMLRHGGYGAIPLLPKGDHAAGDLLPGYSIVPWTYTDLSLPCWDLHRDFIGLDTREVPSPQKLGLTAYPGWSAYWIGGVTLVKQARVVAGQLTRTWAVPLRHFAIRPPANSRPLGHCGRLSRGSRLSTPSTGPCWTAWPNPRRMRPSRPWPRRSGAG